MLDRATRSLPREHIRFFIRTEAAITDGLAGLSGPMMQNSLDPCREKDVRQTIQLVRDFSGG